MWRTYQSNGAEKDPSIQKEKIMNTYIRNWVICLIVNAVIFCIGWTCIVPDQLSDQTHLFGLIGSVEIVKGNTSTVFGVCAVLSTLVMIAGMVEAIVEDFHRPCFNQSVRVEKPRKAPKISGMKIADPTPEKVAEPTSPEKVDEDKDPKTPTMD